MVIYPRASLVIYYPEPDNNYYCHHQQSQSNDIITTPDDITPTHNLAQSFSSVSVVNELNPTSS